KFLKRNRRLRLERLPAYAPELSPVEAVWCWLEWGRVCNFVPGGLDDLGDLVIEYLVALRHGPRLVRGLWERAGLPFAGPPGAQPQRSNRDYLRVSRFGLMVAGAGGGESGAKHAGAPSAREVSGPRY